MGLDGGSNFRESRLLSVAATVSPTPRATMSRSKRLPVNGVLAHCPPHVVILGAGASRACLPEGDRNGRWLPLMDDFVETLELQDLLRYQGVGMVHRNFEVVCDDLEKAGNTKALSALENRVTDYFSALRLPDVPTIYDRLVASLRGKDLIATFNWDPLLLQAYRRIGLRDDQLPQLAFLHGSVGVGICLGCRAKGVLEHACASCGRPFTRSRLLYPIRKKSYTDDPFIEAEWYNLRQHLKASYIISVFGYRAPETDAAAVELMHQAAAAADPQMQGQRQFEIIDIRARDDLEASWRAFIVRDHRSIFDRLDYTFLGRFPRRSCEGMMSCFLFLDPWPDNPMPQFETLTDLRAWIEPLACREGSQ